MSVDIKLNDDVVWGTSEVGTLQNVGKILSCTQKNTVKQYEEGDENDEVDTLILYDKRKEFALEVLAAGTATLPEPGDEMDVNGVTAIIVTESEIAWKRGATKKFNITGWKKVPDDTP